MNKCIFYIGDFKASKQDAQFQLVYGNALIFNKLGYDVVFIGNDNNLAKTEIEQSHVKMKNFDVYNIPFSKSSKDLFKIFKTNKQIKNIISKYPLTKYVINYGSPCFAIEIKLLHKFCRKKDIRLINNCVDLSSLRHGTGIQRIFKSVDNYLKRKFIKKYSDGIIGVSTYIVNYFKQYNKCPKIIIPPLKENMKKNIAASNNKDDTIKKVIYIGEPFPIDGRKVDESAYKDRLDLFIDLITTINNNDKKFLLDVYGITKEQYIRVVTRHQEVIDKSDSIIFHGRVRHEELKNILDMYDFSIVFREKNQMTMAGFSSKLVESICNGVPVILTDTSDYSYYLQDGINCFFVDERMNEESVKKMLKISELDRSDIEKMKRNCIECKKFNYELYVESMAEFLQDVDRYRE